VLGILGRKHVKWKGWGDPWDGGRLREKGRVQKDFHCGGQRFGDELLVEAGVVRRGGGSSVVMTVSVLGFRKRGNITTFI